MRQICIFTGTRAEYGIMSRLFKLINDDPELQLQIIATNMHLSPEFGLTYKEIEADGFKIDKKVEMLLSSDTANGTVKSMGLATIGFADALEDLKPDIAVILGDRYEMLAAAQACLIYKVPVAHLYGGEVTEGAYDDCIRHAITKLSHIHFTSTEEYRRHIIQMGEQPNHVFYVGALGVDNIMKEQIMSRSVLEESLNFKLGDKTMQVTFHPVTMEDNTAELQILQLLKVLEQYPDYRIIFTYPNSDGGGRIIRQHIDDFVNANKDRCLALASLGKRRYYSMLSNITVVIGNSSSGLVEVPSFGIPTLNIGDRQKGRAQGSTIVNCIPTYEGIMTGLEKALSYEFQTQCKSKDNPYYKPNTLENIFFQLKNFPIDGLIEKHFYEL